MHNTYPQQPAPSTPGRRRRRAWPWVLLSLGVAIIALVGGCAALLGGGGGGGEAVTPTSKATHTGTTVRIGDKVRDGKFEFVVTSITHQKSVGPSMLKETAKGRYAIVHLTVTNIGDEAQTLDDSAQYVYDTKGRKFSADSAADIALGGDSGESNTWFEQINPGTTVKGRIAFDMPKTDKPVRIELHDSAFSGGVTVTLR